MTPPKIVKHPLAPIVVTPPPQAPTKAPAQVKPATAEGAMAKTAPTFNQSPQLAPKPPDNGSTGPISTQPQPPKKGPVRVVTQQHHPSSGKFLPKAITAAHPLKVVKVRPSGDSSTEQQQK